MQRDPSRSRPARAPGIRLRPSVERCEPRILLAPILVTTTADDGRGSLRAAIEQANADPLADEIKFDIGGGGRQVIQPLSPLPTIINPVVVDGTSQPDYSALPLVILDGSKAGPFGDGLDVAAPRVVIQGLAVINFSGSGIGLLGGSEAVVQGNYLGVDPESRRAAGNLFDGLTISASGATVGGTTDITANVIGGNGQNGISLGLGASRNVVMGNTIGAIDANTPVPNRGDGVFLNFASGNTIGRPGASNLIVSNMGSGIHLTLSSGNTIQANAVGLNSGGSIGLDSGILANRGSGLLLDLNSSNNTIGGDAAGAGNVLSNNLSYGLVVAGGSANLIQGNRIGTSSAGNRGAGNQLGGILLGDSIDNTIGGTTSGSANVISSNTGAGIQVRQSDTDPSNNLIRGNFIGLGLDGTTSLGNTGSGIQLEGAAGNAIVGNFVSSNGASGIFLNTSRASGNSIRGNVIGLDRSGRQRANLGDGVLASQAPDNTIGGTSAADRNVISGNGGNGVSFRGPGATRNALQGNYIGTDLAGSAVPTAGNFVDGVLILNAPGNTIGGTSSGAGNVISQNRIGVDIQTVADSRLGSGDSALKGGRSDGNVIQGNKIGTDVAGNVEAGNLGEGVLIVDASDNRIGGPGPGAGNLISANLVDGIGIISSDLTLDPVSGNVVQGNVIGLNGDGTSGLGNGQAGVRVVGGTDTVIGGVTSGLGGTSPGPGNVISGNVVGLDIVAKVPGVPMGVRIRGNIIGLGSDGFRVDPASLLGDPVRNTSDGIVLEKGAAGVTVGGTAAGEGNVISGNSSSGIRFASGTSAGLIQGNLIGVARDGLTPRPNNQSGLFFGEGAGAITVGGTAAGAGNVISGNAIGVTLANAGTSDNLFQGNLVGLALDGSTDVGNIAYGFLLLDGASNNTIGGAEPGARNVISGNGQGLQINGPTVVGTVIQGNYVGLDATGRLARGNQQVGIGLNNSSDNLLGGTAPGEGNVISANGGVGLVLSGPGSTRNRIAGNLIGLDASGSQVLDPSGAALGNASYGIQLDNATANTIGGDSPGSRNVISGNRLAGIEVNGVGSFLTVIQGNYIGLDASGRVALGNAAEGILVDNAPGVVIGGGSGLDGNVITGNAGNGISILGAGSFLDTVAGNLIGVDATGVTALGNALSGVFVGEAPGVTIGGRVSTRRNVITGNGQHGIRIAGAGSAGTVVLGNQIGVDASGIAAPGNVVDGVNLDGTTGVTIGGASAGSGNVLSGNGTAGIEFLGSATLANVAQGNAIGADASGRIALPNLIGVFLNNAPFNLVGGVEPFSGNLISGNAGPGVELFGPGATSNAVQGNKIGTDLLGSAALANQAGVFIDGAPGNLIGGQVPASGNLISGNLNGGVILQGSNATGNLVQANLIGLDVTGTLAIAPAGGATAQQQSGILLTDAPRNVIGGSVPSAGNVVSGNVAGVVIAGFNAQGNLVLGNLLGTDATGRSAVGNVVGLYINGSSSNTVGGPNSGDSNLISGNTSTGITLFGEQTVRNVIAGNRIGTDLDGSAAVPNQQGIFLDTSFNNTIGGATSEAGNLISGNTITGVYVFDAASGNDILRNRIGFKANGKPLGNGQYGALLFNAPRNNVPRSGASANRIGNSGIANFREFTGPVTGTASTPAAAKAAKGPHPKGPRLSNRRSS